MYRPGFGMHTLRRREQSHVEAILDRLGHTSKETLANMKVVGGIH